MRVMPVIRTNPNGMDPGGHDNNLVPNKEDKIEDSVSPTTVTNCNKCESAHGGNATFVKEFVISAENWNM